MDLSSLFKKKKYSGSVLGAQKLVEGPVVTRIAPSPTGPLHVGTARSALFNFLYAHRHKGTFIVRIEDTDQERSKKEYEDDILEGLQWLGIEADDIFRQSERTEIYQSYITQLIEDEYAYVSKEESKNEALRPFDKTQGRPEEFEGRQNSGRAGKQIEVVRLKNPNTKVSFEDAVRGRVSFDTTELGDFVIARSATEPLYHLAVVIDDYEMKITHVIRGEDHISNTPRQILIQRSLGLPRPQYVHIPLILSKDRSKMSKRTGGMSIQELRKQGYLPEAVVNYLALLGWNPGGPEERFTLDELIQIFALEKIQRGGAVFDIEKLNWFNRQYMKGVSEKQFSKMVEGALPKKIIQLPGYDEKILERLVPVLKEKIKAFNDINIMAEAGDFDYYFEKPVYDARQLLWKSETDVTVTQNYLQEVYARLEHIPTGSFEIKSVKKAVWDFAEEHGRGAVLWPMRFALSGKEKSPDPFTLAHVLGKKETLERLQKATERLESNN